jgi:hypothetical protein
MLLFDDINRVAMEPKTELETSFEFLNRSARPAFGLVRDEIERWLTCYPHEHRDELVARFRCEFDSPWYELFLHQMFLNLNAKLYINPVVGYRGKRPEFQVCLNESEFVVEATLFTEETSEARNQERSVGLVLDEINKLDVPFFLSIDRVRCPKHQQIAPTRVIAFLRRELATIDADELIEQKQYHQLPRLEFVDGEASIEFGVLPKSKEERKKKSRVIGMQSKGFSWGSSEAGLRKALEAKGKKYGELNQPFLIAVNTLGLISLDESELRSALFGSQQEYVPAGGNESLIRHLNNRFWGTEDSPKHQRVSGVLLGMALPWNIPRMKLTLFCNPWAACALPQIEWPFPEVSRVEEGFQVKRPETDLASLFQLQPDWPGEFFD